jgi:hypothetical protein
VRVDAARHDDASRGVDRALGALRRERAGSGDRRDGLAGDGDVKSPYTRGGYDVTALDDQLEHRASFHRWFPRIGHRL